MIKGFALTDIGLKRKINQDSVFFTAEKTGSYPNLAVLADGMGGYKAGEYASAFTVDYIVDYMKKSRCGSAVALKNAITTCNTLINRKACREKEFDRMGSTVVAAVIEDGLITVANVGDSRLYVIRDEMHQITRDHSLVEEMILKGEMTRDSEEYRKNKKYLTRAVGAEKNIVTDFFDEELEDGDYVLLCSDGLTNMVTEEQIFGIVKGNGSLEEKASALVDSANKNGGSDNIAVILISYVKGGDENV